MESSTSDLRKPLNDFTPVPHGLYPAFYQKRQKKLCKDWKVWAYHKPPAPKPDAKYLKTAKIPSKSIAKHPNTTETDGTVTYKGEEFYENGSVRYRGTYNSSGDKHGPGQYFSICDQGYPASNQKPTYNYINYSKSSKENVQRYLAEELTIEASYSNGTRHGVWTFYDKAKNQRNISYFIVGPRKKSAWNFDLKNSQEVWPEPNDEPYTDFELNPLTVNFLDGDMTGVLRNKYLWITLKKGQPKGLVRIYDQTGKLSTITQKHHSPLQEAKLEY